MALCQSVPQPAQPLTQIMVVPDYILYDDFFIRVNWLNHLADSLDAAGQNGNWARSQVARQAALTPQEAQSLNAIATDYQATNASIVAAIVSLAAGGASAANTQQMQSLQNQRKQNVLAHIAELQTAFGDSRFQQFGAYVHGTSGVKAFAEPSAGQAQPAGKEQPL